MSKKENRTVSKQQDRQMTTITNGAISFLNDKYTVVKYFSVFIISAIIYFIAAKILLATYNTHIDAAIKYAESILCIGGYQPEPLEKALYFLGVFVFVVSFFGLIALFNRIQSKISDKTINTLYWIVLPLTIISIMVLVFKGFSAQNPFFENIQNSQDVMKSNWDFYFSTTFLLRCRPKLQATMN